MRTQRLFTVAAALCATALLWGPPAAHAQTWPYTANGYYQGYGPAYRTAPVAYSGYYNYPQAARPAYPAPYGQGYSTYPGAAYPNYSSAYQRYYPYRYPYSNPQTTNAWTEQPAGAAKTEAATGQPAEMTKTEAPAGLPAAAGCAPEVALPPLAEPAPEPEGHDKASKKHHWGWFEPKGKECFWVGAGYDVAFVQPMRLSTPLVTTGSAGDAHAGAFGQPGTAVLFGGSPVDFGMLSGLRGEAGIFLDCDHILSLDWAGMWLFPEHVRYATESDASGNPVITRPIFNNVSNEERAFANAFPNLAAGGINVDVRTELFSTEVNARLNCNDPEGTCHADLLFGFRYLRLQERITINDQLRPLAQNALTFQGVPVNAPESLSDVDSFGTANDFYGLQLGARVRWQSPWCYLGLYAKCALGATDEQVSINGSTTLFTPTGTQVARGGVLALPSNIGTYNRTELTFVPEGGLNVGVRVTPHLWLTAGYSFLYWDKVVRPGAQIDHVVNPTQVSTDVSFGQSTGATRPVFHFSDESFWVHQLVFGLDFHY